MCKELFFNEENNLNKLSVQMSDANIAVVNMHYFQKIAKSQYARHTNLI